MSGAARYTLLMNTDEPLEPTPESPAHPLDAMREAYRAADLAFEDDQERLVMRLVLETMSVVVISFGEPNDCAQVLVRLPLRAPKKLRAKTGEFLHRLNFGMKRKFWEMDYNDGEIGLSTHFDTSVTPLTRDHFQMVLRGLLQTADTVFPYIAGVVSGLMVPSVADDQAQAALQAMWDKLAAKNSR